MTVPLTPNLSTLHLRPRLDPKGSGSRRAPGEGSGGPGWVSRGKSGGSLGKKGKCRELRR